VVANDFGKGMYCNILKWIDEKHEKCAHVFGWPKEGFFKVDVTGAVVLMSRAVCEKVKYAWDVQGEDIAFCRNAQKEGYEVWATGKPIADHRMIEA
jgi:GT2 family glycosyltransferase